jgi:hypothetical protein
VNFYQTAWRQTPEYIDFFLRNFTQDFSHESLARILPLRLKLSGTGFPELPFQSAESNSKLKR